MRRVLVLNNYSFDRVWAEVSTGEKPDHHLFGLNYFKEAGYSVEIIPFGGDGVLPWLQRLSRRCRVPIPLGDLKQQAMAWKRRHQADLIYAPCQTQTQILGCLRYLGCLDVPIVCLAHHPIERGRMAVLRRPWLRANLLGTDCYPSLSQKVAEEINILAGRRHSTALNWGPQCDYYKIAAGPGRGAVAAGRTGRDFVTFGRAATEAKVDARIICLESNISDAFAQFGPGVAVDAYPEQKPLDYRSMMQVFTSARVLAIPMVAGSNLSGLTSLMDALGVGRPVIMTKNPYIDLDIEYLGIGRWVASGDVEGWVNALRWFDDHPVEAMEMGRRARALVDGGLNAKAFARSMIRHFDDVFLGQLVTIV